MYGPLKSLALRAMRAPEEPPEAPAGSHASIRIHRASPRYLSYRLLGFWITLGIGAFAFAAGAIACLVAGQLIGLLVLSLVSPFLATFFFVLYFVVRIDYDMRYYIVTDRSMRVREGAVTVKEMTITYANVQNLRVVQGPLMRVFGIWNLEVDTAGGGGAAGPHGAGAKTHSICMAGIENAHEVRDRVLDHLRARGLGTGLGDLDDEHAAALGSEELVAALRAVRESASRLRTAAQGSA